MGWGAEERRRGGEVWLGGMTRGDQTHGGRDGRPSLLSSFTPILFPPVSPHLRRVNERSD